MLRAASTPAVARRLSASAVAAILPSSGSSNATGQITLTTALAAQPVGTVSIYLPAGVVTAGSQGSGAGLYQATFSSTTVCQLTGTGIVTGNAAYTQTTNEVALVTTSIPAGAMGLNGGVRAYASTTNNNSGGNKSIRLRLGGLAGTTYYSVVVTTTLSNQFERGIRNRNSAASQVGSNSPTATGAGSSSGALVTSTVDTSASVDLVFSGQLAVATDYLVYEYSEVWLLP